MSLSEAPPSVQLPDPEWERYHETQLARRDAGGKYVYNSLQEYQEHIPVQTLNKLTTEQSEILFKATQVFQSLPEEEKFKNIITVLDPDHDFDDFQATAVESTLKAIGFFGKHLAIANLYPAEMRARHLFGVLKSLHANKTTVVAGLDEITHPPPDNPLLHYHQMYDYEYSCNSDPGKGKVNIESYLEPLEGFLREAHENGKKVDFISMSGRQTIGEALKTSIGDLWKKDIISRAYFQGSAWMDENGILRPDEGSSNDRFDLPGSKFTYAKCQEEDIPTFTTSRCNAIPLGDYIDGKWFRDLAETGHPLGEHMYHLFKSVSQYYYENPKFGGWQKLIRDRFHMPPEMKSDFLEEGKTSGKAPDFERVKDYASGVLYDVFAILESAGPLAEELGITSKQGVKNLDEKGLHQLSGFTAPNSEIGKPAVSVSGTYTETAFHTITAFTKAALLGANTITALKALDHLSDDEFAQSSVQGMVLGLTDVFERSAYTDVGKFRTSLTKENDTGEWRLATNLIPPILQLPESEEPAL